MVVVRAFKCARASSFVALLCVALVSTTCGFHPRGSIVRTSDLGSIFVDAELDITIAENIREALLDSAFVLAPNRDKASILLRLTREASNQRVVSVTSNGRVSELELTHAVDMLIAESKMGETPVYPPDPVFNRVEVTREYTYDETGVLGKENEARILREEMKRDLVRQIILRSIASLTPSITS